MSFKTDINESGLLYSQSNVDRVHALQNSNDIESRKEHDF